MKLTIFNSGVLFLVSFITLTLTGCTSNPSSESASDDKPEVVILEKKVDESSTTTRVPASTTVNLSSALDPSNQKANPIVPKKLEEINQKLKEQRESYTPPRLRVGEELNKQQQQHFEAFDKANIPSGSQLNI